ncbi:hypothetical protein AB8A31_06740 [Tardiphaga sp. 804_B3_N1_9]|uniref:hypothetical protein n=1 Tax=Tardiphaga sp. 804_B3_N1_9 TaxID=3240786 RepID=UPI003F28B8F0
MARTLPIGQRQAKRILQMSPADRLAFLAEGLPIILTSAQSFWAASLSLLEMPREARVLKSFAKEEAAKILILMDLVRCPKQRSERESIVVGRFYGHLERLIYAQVAEGWSEDVARLRKRVEPLRKAHYLEGNLGEYILPNSVVYDRESKLYADIEAYEDGAPLWSAPTAYQSPFPQMMPPVLAVAEAMSACGMFTVAGLTAVAEIWGEVDFVDKETLQAAERLTQKLLERLISEDLPVESATQEHVGVLYRHWPLPMYDVDLTTIPVTLEELKAEQDRLLWAEAGH